MGQSIAAVGADFAHVVIEESVLRLLLQQVGAGDTRAAVAVGGGGGGGVLTCTVTERESIPPGPRAVSV